MACRPTYLAKLLAVLSPQIKKDVEILISIDNADRQIGTKRNELIESAKGEYIVFIDDDDMVTENYVLKIMEGIGSGADYISISQVFHDTEHNIKRNVVSKFGSAWSFSDGIYIRGVQHIGATKKSLAIQYPFPEISFGEDKSWGYAMDKLVKSQYTIDEPIYFYEFRRLKDNETTNAHKK